MRAPRLYLYDDPVARAWHPFSLTGPVGELLFGTETLRARTERVLGTRCRGHLAGEHLVGFAEAGAPSCMTIEELSSGGPRLLINSRFVPDQDKLTIEATGPVLLVAESGIVGAWIPGGEAPLPALLTGDRPPGWPEHVIAGRLLEAAWEMMAGNADRIRLDGSGFRETPIAADVHRIGSGRLVAAADAVIEPGVVIDTTGGPVVLASGSRVQGPARLEGPLYLGPDSVILGGSSEVRASGPAAGSGERFRPA